MGRSVQHLLACVQGETLVGTLETRFHYFLFRSLLRHLDYSPITRHRTCPDTRLTWSDTIRSGEATAEFVNLFIRALYVCVITKHTLEAGK